MNKETEERLKVIEIAKSWLNTPYHHMGKIKGAGADCLTLLACIYEESGLINKVDVPYYPQDWHLHRAEERYLKGILQYTHEIDIPKPADIILWKFGRCYSHGAIIVEWPMVIHAYVNVGCIYQDVNATDFFRTTADRTPGKPGDQIIRPYKFFSFWK